MQPKYLHQNMRCCYRLSLTSLIISVELSSISRSESKPRSFSAGFSGNVCMSSISQNMLKVDRSEDLRSNGLALTCFALMYDSAEVKKFLASSSSATLASRCDIRTAASYLVSTVFICDLGFFLVVRSYFTIDSLSDSSPCRPQRRNFSALPCVSRFSDWNVCNVYFHPSAPSSTLPSMLLGSSKP